MSALYKQNTEHIDVVNPIASSLRPLEVDEAREVQNKRILRRIDKRIPPLCAFLYFLNYLDRSNLGNGKILNTETGDSLLQRTGMSESDYSITLSVFAVAYTIFDIPSNAILKRYARPSYWLGALLFGWGALTLGFTGVQNWPTVVVLRFLIGVFEAGFFPGGLALSRALESPQLTILGMVYIITFWYRQEERSVRIAFILATSTLAGAFGGCIAYGMGTINRKGGLEGFRWLFLVEGLITVLTTPLVVFCLPDYPRTAKWLSLDEKRSAQERVSDQGGGYSEERASSREILETITSLRMLAHYLAYVSLLHLMLEENLGTVTKGSLTAA